MYSQIPLSPENFITVIKYQTFQTLFHRPSFESVANILSSFETNLGYNLFKVIRFCEQLPVRGIS